MKEIIIPQKKGAYIKILLMSGLPFLYLAYTLLQKETFSLLILVCLSILTVVLGCIFVTAIFNLLNNKPAMIINQKGVTDNISMAKAGFIPWNNINGCFIGKLSGVDQLMIKLKNYEPIMDMQKGYRKGMLKVPIEDHGTPIAINIKLLDYNVERLKKMIISKRTY